MSRIWKATLVALFALVIAAPAASARGRVLIGYGGFYGPAWYGPGWYGPAWGPGYYGPYERTGNVKIVTETKGNSVYVDGGFAGVTGKLKKFPLRPGTHTIEFRDAHGHSFYQERIQVILGKTIEIRPDYRG